MVFAVRAAEAHDYPHFVALFAELGVPDPTPTPAAFEALLPGLIVATGADGVVGYASWRIYGALAHVVNVVTAPAHRGRGVGHALMTALRLRVEASGATRWYLNVKRDNTTAIRLYERLGMTIEGPAWALEYRWSLRETLPPGPMVRVITPSFDAVESLRMVPAQLAALAERGRVIVGLERDDELVACAAFDPRYPGAYPFATREPRHARALLDALHEHRDPAHADLVRIALDHDEALAELLLDHGATLSFALWRMQGPIGS